MMKSQNIKDMFGVALGAMGNVLIKSEEGSQSLVDILLSHGKEDAIIARWILEVNALGALVYDANLLPLILVKDIDLDDQVMVCFDDDAEINFTSTEPAISMSFILHAGMEMFNINNLSHDQECVVSREEILAPLKASIEAVEDGDVISPLPLMYKEICINALSALQAPVRSVHVSKP